MTIELNCEKGNPPRYLGGYGTCWTVDFADGRRGNFLIIFLIKGVSFYFLR
jgi:hypothetical protein